MFYFLTAIGAVIAAMWGWRRFKAAAPAMRGTLARQAAGWLAIALGIILTTRGAPLAAFIATMIGSWLISGRWLPTLPGGGSTPGQDRRSSRVATDHLEMVLDHATGAMKGRVLKGVFAGRQIERLAPAELALLWRDCRFADPKSAALIEAWLDGTHPTWREDMSRAEGEPGAGGIMTRQEALDILGLKEGAAADEIRRAHRDLIKRMHPDAGGSSYLATKINEAKDLLLKGG